MSHDVRFNKYGNFSFDENGATFQIPTEHLKNDDPSIIERDFKRFVTDHSLQNQLIVPNEISNQGRYTILKYELYKLHDFSHLFELTLADKLDYYRSLVSIAIAEQNGQITLPWERSNIILDTHEKNIKVLLYQTESIPIYNDEERSIVKSVRDLILVSMTRLNKILTIPKLPDLLEHNEINKEFCQAMYHIDNLDDMLYLIQDTELRLMEQNTEEDLDDEIETKATKKKRLFAKKEKPSSDKQTNVPRPNVSTKKKSILNRFEKKHYILLVILLVALIINYATGSDSKKTTGFEEFQDENGATSTYFKSSSNQAVTKSLVNAYRLSYSGQRDKAYTVLQTLNLRDLSTTDLPMIIEIYDSQNDLSTLLDDNPVPEMANQVITYLIKNDSLNKLVDIHKEMETTNPYVEFETAYLEREYEKVIELHQNVSLNGRKEGQIVESYLQLGKVQEATEFAQKIGNPDLLKQIDSYNKF